MWTTTTELIPVALDGMAVEWVLVRVGLWLNCIFAVRVPKLDMHEIKWKFHSRFIIVIAPKPQPLAS